MFVRFLSGTVILGIAGSVSGCAKKWAEDDDAQCKRMGMIGPYYVQCRQMLTNQRSAAIAQISSGLSQVGQATSPSNSPAIIPPCIGSSRCNDRRYNKLAITQSRKRNMHLLLTAFFIVACLVVGRPLKAQDTTTTMQTLKQFMSKNDPSKDLAAVEHVVVRCYAYYGVITTLMDGENRPDRKDGVKRGLAAMDKLSNFWLKLSLQIQPNLAEDARLRNFKTQSMAMAKAYMDRVNATRARTGNMFDDEVLNSDSTVCLEVTNSL